MSGDGDQDDQPTIVVMLPSGETTTVRRPEDAAYLTTKSEKYLADYEWTRAADLGALDNIVTFELLLWRWGRWLHLGTEDDGSPIVPRQISESIKQISGEVRQLKAGLGIDKRTIDRTMGDGSLAEFIDRLKTGALAMNAHRHEMVDITLEHAMQLRTMVTIYNNGDEEEWELYGCTPEEILHWITVVFDPAMQAADDHFAVHEQSIWIQDMQSTR